MAKATTAAKKPLSKSAILQAVTEAGRRGNLAQAGQAGDRNARGSGSPGTQENRHLRAARIRQVRTQAVITAPSPSTSTIVAFWLVLADCRGPAAFRFAQTAQTLSNPGYEYQGVRAHRKPL